MSSIGEGTRMNVSAVVKVAVVAMAGLLVFGCGDAKNTSGSGSDLKGSIRIDGSSTVSPLSEAAAEDFQTGNSGVRVTVGTSGTGGGFEKFCRAETDLSDASRPIEPEETAACKKADIAYHELQIANDGIALVVNTENDWAECLTVEQLKKIWDLDSKVDNWKDVDSKFPDEKLTLYGPGTDSGTFDFFTEAINGKEGRSRSDYNATEDDNVTVQGVSGSKGGLGYFGLSYVEQNSGKVTPVAVDAGDGCVSPSTKTVQDESYAPLSRPLFIYPSDKLLRRAEGAAFVTYFANNAAKLAERALFVPLTADQNDKLSEEISDLTKK